MTEHNESSVTRRKQELREDLRRRLAGVAAQDARALAARIADRALEIPEVAHAHGVLACLSFGEEVDTWDLVDRLRSLGHAIYVPRADPKDGQLHVHPYPCELRTLSFGLQQPPRGTPEVDEEDIPEVVDVALVLGLGFDRRGYRLGHGSGYFDRFLARRPLPAVGLAFDFQLLDQLPTAPHDLPMSAIVTESTTLRLKPGAAMR